MGDTIHINRNDDNKIVNILQMRQIGITTTSAAATTTTIAPALIRGMHHNRLGRQQTCRAKMKIGT